MPVEFPEQPERAPSLSNPETFEQDNSAMLDWFVRIARWVREKNVLIRGDFGLGNSLGSPDGLYDYNNINNRVPMFIGHASNGDDTLNEPTLTAAAVGWQVSTGNGGPRAAQYVAQTQGTNDRVRHHIRSRDTTGWTPWAEIQHTVNTTVDGNGFLKAASPIVRLYADRIEEPNMPVNAEMRRIGTGHYLITGTPPMAAEGWQTQAPDGCIMGTPQFSEDGLHVRIYRDGAPSDVPEGAFAMLRFWEPDGENDAPPAIETVTNEQEKTAALEEWRGFAELTRTNFVLACRRIGLLSVEGAKVAAKGDIPDELKPSVENMPPEVDRDELEITWAGLTRVPRNHPFLNAIQATEGVSDEIVDGMFGWIG